MATPPKPFEQHDDFLTRAENFYEQNKKAISIGGSIILIAVIGIIAFNSFYLPNKEQEAQEQMFMAQQYFARDSFRLALNGDGNYDGFLQIIDNYKWTKAASLSKYYAGVSSLKLGEFDKAIEYLDDFSSNESLVNSTALGALGDAYSEKNEMDKAVSYYKKAADKTDNKLLSPYYLFKAGMALKVQGKNEEARDVFQQIKEKYPDSNESREAEKYIPTVS